MTEPIAAGEPGPRPQPSELEARLILAYRNRALTVDEVLAVCDSTRWKLDRTLRKYGEPFRRPASAKRSPRAGSEAGLSRSRLREVAADLGGRRSEEPLGRRLERLLAARIDDLEDRVAPGRSADPDGTAKALALNVRTLAALRRVASGPADDAARDPTEPPPRSLNELRDLLHGHLLRLRHDEKARRRARVAGAHAD